ncbi:MAG TPA: hypothetical protein VLC97_13835 [Rhodanobacteraceae bacterium]|nr:hypothetical protein [Rhodanobacteraceae bacterium]
MSKLGTTALLLVVAISASDAQACGEVMYRMGGALRYHAFITRHPAEILLYNGTAAQQAATADSQRFHENLEKAGHKVTVVDGPEALTKALGERSYDVIITYAADLPAISAQIAHVSREPALIPVFQRSDQEAMRKQYPLALNDDANLNQFLRTIEQTMKSRGT